jgi:hypothetical protein
VGHQILGVRRFGRGRGRNNPDGCLRSTDSLKCRHDFANVRISAKHLFGSPLSCPDAFLNDGLLKFTD